MPSSPPRSWGDLAGRSVGIFGAGVEGSATLAKLASIGLAPAVVVDDRPPESFPATVLATAAGGWERLAGCDVVVKSPGISRYRDDVVALARGGVEVVGGLGLFMEEVDRSRVLLVTGTKGKSTTSAILGHLLNGLGRSARVGGNLGTVPYDPHLEDGEGAGSGGIAGQGGIAAGAGNHDAAVGGAAPGSGQWWVIEASSFQILDLWHAPRVVTLTSLGSDHLDWHGDHERYAADKLSVVALPGVEVVVVNGTDPVLAARPELAGRGPAVVSVGAEEAERAGWAAALGLIGSHNRLNAALAAATLAAAGIDGASDERALERAAAGFRPLRSRLEPVAVVGGVQFVDDSLATNVLATVAAIDAFEGRRLALLAGGHDRGVDYAPLAARLRRRDAPTLVLALPDNGERILAEIESSGLPPWLCLERCDDLAQAVPRAADFCRPDGVVLLSPAAPSFGRFTDWKDRSEAFRRYVASLGS